MGPSTPRIMRSTNYFPRDRGNLLLLLGALAGAAWAGVALLARPAPPLPEGVVARVGDEAITEDAYRRARKRLYRRAHGDLEADHRLQKESEHEGAHCCRGDGSHDRKVPPMTIPITYIGANPTDRSGEERLWISS